MSDRLSKIHAPKGANMPKIRAGRGVGSGLGKTAGRGQKGQKARSTGGIGRLHFQGGQTPMQRRLPKRGFRNPFPVMTAEVNVGALESFDAGTVVDERLLRDHGFIKGRAERVKILGDGELTKKLTVVAHRFSKAALEKIQAAGGKIETIAVPNAEDAQPAG